jgi:hypothetical protein
VLGYVAVEVTHGKAWFNWILPIVVLAAMVKFTEWYPGHARTQAFGAPAASTAT